MTAQLESGCRLYAMSDNIMRDSDEIEPTVYPSDMLTRKNFSFMDLLPNVAAGSRNASYPWSHRHRHVVAQ